MPNNESAKLGAVITHVSGPNKIYVQLLKESETFSKLQLLQNIEVLQMAQTPGKRVYFFLDYFNV